MKDIDFDFNDQNMCNIFNLIDVKNTVFLLLLIQTILCSF